MVVRVVTAEGNRRVRMRFRILSSWCLSERNGRRRHGARCKYLMINEMIVVIKQKRTHNRTNDNNSDRQ